MSLTLTWQPPRHDGGQRVTGFVVEMLAPPQHQYHFRQPHHPFQSPQQQQTLDLRTALVVYRGPDSHVKVPGLQPGGLYHFRVQACNALGAGPWSEWAALGTSPAHAPAAPLPPCQAGEPTSTALRVLWQPPDPRGAPVTGYVLEFALLGRVRSTASGSGGQAGRQPLALLPSPPSASLQLAHQGRAASTSLVPHSGHGSFSGSASPAHDLLSSISQPLAFRNAGGGGGHVVVNGGNGNGGALWVRRPAHLHPPGFASLSDNGSVVFVEHAHPPPPHQHLQHHHVGHQVPHPPPPPGFPAVPVPGGNGVIVSRPLLLQAAPPQHAQHAPQHAKGAAELLHLLPPDAQQQLLQQQVAWQVAYRGPLLTAAVAGLQPRTRYLLRVAATNAVGQGDWSPVALLTTAPAPPTAPLAALAYAEGPDAARVVWQAPAADNGALVTSYLIEVALASSAAAASAAAGDSDLLGVLFGEEEGLRGADGWKQAAEVQVRCCVELLHIWYKHMVIQAPPSGPYHTRGKHTA